MSEPDDRSVVRYKENGFKNTRDEVRQELERVAFGDAPSGRQALAKVTALRTIERLSRPAGPLGERLDADGRWHPGPPEFWDLDRHHSDEQRERWRRNWEADPGRTPSRSRT